MFSHLHPALVGGTVMLGSLIVALVLTRSRRRIALFLQPAAAAEVLGPQLHAMSAQPAVQHALAPADRKSAEPVPLTEGRLVLVQDLSSSMRFVAGPVAEGWQLLRAKLVDLCPRLRIRAYGVHNEVVDLNGSQLITPDELPQYKAENFLLHAPHYQAGETGPHGILKGGSALYTGFHRALLKALQWREEEGYSGPIVVMMIADGWPRLDSCEPAKVAQLIEDARGKNVLIMFRAFIDSGMRYRAEAFVKSLRLRPNEVTIAYWEGDEDRAQTAGQSYLEAADGVTVAFGARRGCPPR